MNAYGIYRSCGSKHGIRTNAEAVRALTETDARWEALRAYLTAERVSNAAEAREWQHGSPTQAGYASRSIMAGKALAKMTELEAGQ